MRFETVVESPVGPLTLFSDGESVTALRFGSLAEGRCTCAVLEQAAAQLREYFAGERREFTVPLKGEGTQFQGEVWDALREIPYGETVTYGEIACKLGNPKAVRAVGGANHRNPLAIFVPCHRVVGRDGSLTGYAGGLQVKEFLLELEQENR